jgi:hypothetical protein
MLGRKRAREEDMLGSHQLLNQPEETSVSEHVKLSSISAKTSQEPNPSYVLHTTCQMEYLPPNGTISSEENQLISTRYSPPCTLSNLMMRERATWETLRSYLQWQN